MFPKYEKGPEKIFRPSYIPYQLIEKTWCSYAAGCAV